MQNASLAHSPTVTRTYIRSWSWY